MRRLMKRESLLNRCLCVLLAMFLGLPRLIDECGFTVRLLPEDKGFTVLEFMPRTDS